MQKYFCNYNIQHEISVAILQYLQKKEEMEQSEKNYFQWKKTKEKENKKEKRIYCIHDSITYGYFNNKFVKTSTRLLMVYFYSCKDVLFGMITKIEDDIFEMQDRKD